MSNGFIEIDDITKRKFFFSGFETLQKLKENQEFKAYMTLKGKYERACLNYIGNDALYGDI